MKSDVFNRFKCLLMCDFCKKPLFSLNDIEGIKMFNRFFFAYHFLKVDFQNSLDIRKSLNAEKIREHLYNVDGVGFVIYRANKEKFLEFLIEEPVLGKLFEVEVVISEISLEMWDDENISSQMWAILNA